MGGPDRHHRCVRARLLRPTLGWILLGIAAIQTRTGIAWSLGQSVHVGHAALAAGLAFGWATPMVALKPTLGPFALIGIHRRRWWLGAAVLLGLSLPFGTMWFDYATVLLNAKQTAQHGLGYLIGEWPAAAALAFVAWQCRQPRAEPAHDLAHGVAPLAHGRRSPDLEAPFEE